MILDRFNNQGQRTDWLLAAFVAAYRPLTSTELQKSMFLLSKERAGFLPRPFYEFNLDICGPSSSSILQDVKGMQEDGLILAGEDKSSDTLTHEKMVLTPSGWDAAGTCEFDSSVFDYLKKVLGWMEEQRSLSITRAITNKYRSD